VLAIISDGHGNLRRVESDIDATSRKIEAVPELAGWLGDRLREGR